MKESKTKAPSAAQSKSGFIIHHIARILAGWGIVMLLVSASSAQTNPTKFDFDGDGKADFSVWTPTTGVWRVFQSSSQSETTVTWGDGCHRIVPADYDGDGKTDVAAWHRLGGLWSIRKSTNNQTFQFQWGQNGDIPVPADYDGDGAADIAVWRPSSGIWYISKSSQGGSLYAVQFGDVNDVPVPGDYDANGEADVAVWRPSSGIWYVQYSTSLGIDAYQWGQAGDIPVPADYDGDEETDRAVWRPSTVTGGSGEWYMLKSKEGASYAQFGASDPHDVLVPADYNGDEKADLSVWRPSTQVWYVLFSSNLDSETDFGAASDVAVPGVFINQALGTGTGLCTALTGVGAASPGSVAAGGTTLLTVQVTPGSNPTSTGLMVTVDLSMIGGSSTQQFYDNGTNGDQQAGDNIFSFLATVASGTPTGGKNLAITITDAQLRTAPAANIALTVTPPVTPTPLPVPQLSKEYIYSGSRMLAVEDANAP